MLRRFLRFAFAQQESWAALPEEVGLRGRFATAVARIRGLAVAAPATEARALRAMIASCGGAAHWS